MIQDATDKELINKVSELIAQSQRILFITGAEISAESGLPTYRGVGGLYDPILPMRVTPSRKPSVLK